MTSSLRFRQRHKGTFQLFPCRAPTEFPLRRAAGFTVLGGC